MMNQHDTIWDAKLSARIADLWRNHSAREIAFILAGDGHRLTKNQVAGRVKRLGLTLNDKITVHPLTGLHKRTSIPVQASRIPTKVNTHVVNAARLGPKIKIERFKPRVADVETLDIGFMDLTATTCRYPHGGEDGSPITFCGQWCEVDHPYCTAHAKIAYQPPKQRTDQKPHYRERRRAA